MRNVLVDRIAVYADDFIDCGTGVQKKFVKNLAVGEDLGGRGDATATLRAVDVIIGERAAAGIADRLQLEAALGAEVLVLSDRRRTVRAL